MTGRRFSIGDYETAARRRLPACVWEFLSGGVEDNVSRDRNAAAFERWALVPRTLVDVSSVDASVEVFGQRFNAPIGMPPTGVTAIYRPRCDALLAKSFHEAGLPYVISGASTVPLEELAKLHPGAWYQGYFSADRPLLDRICARLEAAGIGVLVVTVDVPVAANRENIARHDFTIPFKTTWRVALDGLLHPRWMAGTLVPTLRDGGAPRFANQTDVIGPRIIDDAPRSFRGGRDRLDWDDIAWLRDRWKGRLVIKGVLHPDDAVRAAEIGCDGVVVSNHGGRQLDFGPGGLDALPGVVAAAGDRLTVMMDGGVRRGSHALIARALGAKMVFAGRPFLWGASVSGAAGLDHVIALFRKEIDIDLALMGCPRAEDIGPAHVTPHAAPGGLVPSAAPNETYRGAA
ncbi:L-lactate dehydrogenase (cytochrome) [Albimonas donghaensis]|uniref:L-lactate dehydrogenase (Cytochrome) n=1 Tax=Albimonas donghaensis TaxID=356660 RepID=A0A1H3E9W0_9RHOB|nr:alpha-hydroxy acid oxidase [Albimonas donghaensis]SDX75380.1 L-lactate dehydrogenase (cytochrome) [Albimonas donghaensis]